VIATTASGASSIHGSCGAAASGRVGPIQSTNSPSSSNDIVLSFAEPTMRSL
jgi:hypothetical protein